MKDLQKTQLPKETLLFIKVLHIQRYTNLFSKLRNICSKLTRKTLDVHCFCVFFLGNTLKRNKIPQKFFQLLILLILEVSTNMSNYKRSLFSWPKSQNRLRCHTGLVLIVRKHSHRSKISWASYLLVDVLFTWIEICNILKTFF